MEFLLEHRTITDGVASVCPYSCRSHSLNIERFLLYAVGDVLHEPEDLAWCFASVDYFLEL